MRLALLDVGAESAGDVAFGIVVGAQIDFAVNAVVGDVAEVEHHGVIVGEGFVHGLRAVLPAQGDAGGGSGIGAHIDGLAGEQCGAGVAEADIEAEVAVAQGQGTHP